MRDDGTAVGDELLGVSFPFGFLGLQAENLKGRGVAAAHRGDCRTAASIMEAIVQRQSVVGICAVTTLKGCMNGFDGLLHLMRGPRFLARLLLVTAVRFSSRLQLSASMSS